MRRTLIALAFLCALPHAAAAQRDGYVELVPPPEHERWFIAFGADLSPKGPPPYANQLRTPNPFLPSAEDIVGADYRPRGGFGLDVGVGVMATPRFGVGASRTKVTFDEVTMHTYGSRPRLIRRGTLIYQDGVFTASDESTARFVEEAYHLELSAVPVRGRRGLIRAFAGPTWYEVSLEMARRIDPVDASRDEENTIDATGWGYHVGADVSTYIPNRYAKFAGLGFGTSIRYTKGTVAGVNALDPAGSRQDYETGGWHWTLGMRARF